MPNNYDYDALTSFIFNGRRSSKLYIDVAYEWCMKSTSLRGDAYPFFTKVNRVSYSQVGAQGTTAETVFGSNNTKITGGFRQNITLDLIYRCYFEMTVSYEVALSLNLDVAGMALSYGSKVNLRAFRDNEPVYQIININDALNASGITNPIEYTDCFDDPSYWDKHDAGGGGGTGGSGDVGGAGGTSGENGDVIVITVEVEPKEVDDEEIEEPEEETPSSGEEPPIA